MSKIADRFKRTQAMKHGSPYVLDNLAPRGMDPMKKPSIGPQVSHEEIKRSLKGKKHGNCNVTACQDPLVRGHTFYNTPMRAWYCQYCARDINRSCDPGQIPFCHLDPEAGSEH